MKQTEKLKLNLIEPQDPVNRDPFNQNAQILEDFSKTLLTPETAKKLGLNPQTATVDQALAKEIAERQKAIQGLIDKKRVELILDETISNGVQNTKPFDGNVFGKYSLCVAIGEVTNADSTSYGSINFQNSSNGQVYSVTCGGGGSLAYNVQLLFPLQDANNRILGIAEAPEERNSSPNMYYKKTGQGSYSSITKYSTYTRTNEMTARIRIYGIL